MARARRRLRRLPGAVPAGFLATEVWRWLGLLVGSRLDVAGEVFQWVRAVATALVAGMVTRMLLFPAGALADVALTVRLTAFAGGFVCYYALNAIWPSASAAGRPC